MKRIITLIMFLIFSSTTQASWSAFVAINKKGASRTPYPFKPEIEIKSIEDKKDDLCTVHIDPKSEYPHKQAFLVLAKRSLSIDELRSFRDYLWGYKEQPDYIYLFSRLGLELDPYKPEIDKQNSYYRVKIDPNSANNVYVYIDFPRVVLDGGYYYSVNINSYCK